MSCDWHCPKEFGFLFFLFSHNNFIQTTETIEKEFKPSKIEDVIQHVEFFTLG